MSNSEPLIRNISDTALWAAVYRASENDRPDAVFHDRFARKLAGSRGQEIADAMPNSQRQAWAWVARTYVFDQFISNEVAQGVDMVVNLAAGLDARPYRMGVNDLASPGLLRILQRNLQPKLDQSGATLRFGPKEGPLFFVSHGWKPIEVRRLLKTAAHLKRLTFWMRLLAMLPESTGEQGSRPWGGVCLLGRD